MSPTFLVNYVTKWRQITNVKVDRWLLYFFRKKLYAMKHLQILHMAKSGRFPHLHTSPFKKMASMRLLISMAIFQTFAILEILEFLVNLRCSKIYPDAVFSWIPKFQFILIWNSGSWVRSEKKNIIPSMYIQTVK
jgi:hypothetical protein